MSAILPFRDDASKQVPLSTAATTFSSTPLNLTAIIDPGCRCLQPSVSRASNPTVSFQVMLQNRNVWPSAVSFVSGDDAVTLWHADLERVDPSSVGTWVTVSVPAAGDHNLWRVGPPSLDGDGTLPPWRSVHVVFHRDSLFGTPAPSEVPIIRSAALLPGQSASDALLVVLSGQFVVSSHRALASLDLADVDRQQAAVSTAAWPDFASVVPSLADIAGGCSSNDCSWGVLLFDVHSGGAGQAAPSFTLGDINIRDKHGRSVSVALPRQAARASASALPSEVLTLHVELNTTTVVGDESFDWHAVHNITFQAEATLGDAGTVNVSNVRLGRPQRVGHVSSVADYNFDDLACDPVAGWFDLGSFVRHDPVRYGHCRECCCYFDDPGSSPSVKHCYEQGDVIAETTPDPAAAPNDQVGSLGFTTYCRSSQLVVQCAVCNRGNNPQVQSPRTTLLSELGADARVPCDDFEACTWNDRCREDGACVADLYTTCLRSDFHGGDPAKNCEVCDGTGPNSTTLGCRAAPGHYV